MSKYADMGKHNGLRNLAVVFGMSTRRRIFPLYLETSVTKVTA